MKGIIIGFGNMGQIHLKHLRNLSIEIPYIIETDPSKTNLIKNLGATHFTDLSQIPNLNDIDFIDICSPTHKHFEHLNAAIKTQKAILIEKPILRNQYEIDQFRNIKYKSPIFIAEVEQYNPALSDFLNYKTTPKKIEISRKVNLKFFLNNTTPWFLNENLSGGITLDLMIHDLTILLEKYGIPEIKEVKKEKQRYNCTDNIKTTLKFKSFNAYLYATWNQSETTNPIETIIKIKETDNKEITIKCNDYLEKNKLPKNDPYFLEIKSFINSIKTGKTPYPIKLYLDATELALKIHSFS